MLFNKKNLLLIVLLLVFSTCTNKKPTEDKTFTENNNRPTESNATQNISQVQLLFIQSPYPCDTCTKLKKLTQRALAGKFSQELKNKRFIYREYDTRLTENEHLIKKYSIRESMLILQKTNGKTISDWKSLYKIYWYINKPAQYKKYLMDEIGGYLK